MVSFKALINNEYNDKNTDTHKSYATCINIFINNFKPFFKYKDSDNLDWVIKDHNALYNEIINHCKIHNLSDATLRLYIMAMMCIIRIYYGNKDNKIYKKYQNIIADIKEKILSIEGQNRLNCSEEKKGGLIPFQLLLNKQKLLYDEFNLLVSKNDYDNAKAYKINQDLLLISLYTLMPPVRNEIKDLLFTLKVPDDNDTNNYIVIINNHTINLYYGGIKKKHDRLIINDNEINKTLKNIIIQSYILYPREAVFTSTHNFPNYDNKTNITNISSRLKDLFKDTKYIVGTSMIRSSFITYQYDNNKLSYNDKINIARLMRTSVDTCNLYYYKICDDIDKDDNIIIPIKEPKQTLSIEEKRNKETRRKLIYRLNNDDHYRNNCSQDTLNRHNVKLVDGKYV